MLAESSAKKALCVELEAAARQIEELREELVEKEKDFQVSLQYILEELLIFHLVQFSLSWLESRECGSLTSASKAGLASPSHFLQFLKYRKQKSADMLEKLSHEAKVLRWFCIPAMARNAPLSAPNVLQSRRGSPSFHRGTFT